jgi:hypothetical protein
LRCLHRKVAEQLPQLSQHLRRLIPAHPGSSGVPGLAPSGIAVGHGSIVPPCCWISIDERVKLIMTALTDAQLQSLAAHHRGIADILDPSVVVTPPVVPPIGVPTPVPDNRFSLVVDEQFDTGKLDPKVWWAPYDGVPGTGGVGMRKGSLCTFRDSNLIIAAGVRARRPTTTTSSRPPVPPPGRRRRPMAATRCVRR